MYPPKVGDVPPKMNKYDFYQQKGLVGDVPPIFGVHHRHNNH